MAHQKKYNEGYEAGSHVQSYGEGHHEQKNQVIALVGRHGDEVKTDRIGRQQQQIDAANARHELLMIG